MIEISQIMRNFITLFTLNFVESGNYYQRYKIPDFLQNGIGKNVPNFNVQMIEEKGSGEAPEILENKIFLARTENDGQKITCLSTRKGMKRYLGKTVTRVTLS